MRNDFQLTPHFNLQEFESHDTGEVLLNSLLVRKLEALRELVQRPVLIISGYRTPEWNIGVGGASNSYHLRGMAADITWLGFNLDNAVVLAERAGFNGIGRYPGKHSIHVDIRGYRARWTKIAGEFINVG